MKTRSFAFVLISLFLLNTIGFAAGDARTARAKKRQISRLVSLLPASDGVAVFDSKRFVDESLPRILTANQSVLAHVMARMNEMENQTGVSLRKFDQMAIGFAMTQISPTNIDFDPVAILSGDVSERSLAAVGKLSSKGSYREEKIGERTVYVFATTNIVKKAGAPAPPVSSKIASAMDKAITGVMKEVAVTSLDKNTLVFGSYARVRQTLESTPRISAELSSLLPARETAVITFACATPAGMSALLPLDNDDLGANIDSIQYVSGFLDVAAIGTTLQMTAKTKKAEQATQLKDTLEGLQNIGKAIFGSSKRQDQQVFGRMLKNAKFEARGTELIFDMVVPQADIDILTSGVK